jgi:hypothetical protein
MKILASAALVAACALAVIVAPSFGGSTTRAAGAVTLAAPRQALEFQTHNISKNLGSATYRNIDAAVGYTARMTCRRIVGKDIWFSYTIPAGQGDLTGLSLMWATREGGASAGFSTFVAAADAVSACQSGAAPSSTHAITAGAVEVL